MTTLESDTTEASPAALAEVPCLEPAAASRTEPGESCELVPSTSSEAVDRLVERLFEATIGALELASVHLGRRLGLYQLLADGRERTAGDLAAAARIAPRYAREWLEQQAVAGLLELVAGGDDAEARRYRLGADEARVLADEDDPAHVAPFASMLAGIGQALPAVVEAYRTGDGVPYHRYGHDFRDGQGGINRPAFVHDLVREWLPAVPEVQVRLVAGARVADVGCGLGWSTSAIARAYPDSEVTGIDADAASIAAARELLPADLDGRVRYVTASAADADRYGPFDVVVILETLHDLGDPVSGLAGIRAALADGGIVFIADERVAERFTAPGDAIERMMYGWSVVHCLPAAVTDGGDDAIGTAIRPATVRRLARAAGFESAETLPIENDLFRFYRLQV